MHHKELEMYERVMDKANRTQCAVNHPDHYNTGKIECIDAIEANLSREEFIGYLRGNVKKYEWRCRYKGHMKQDLEKANWYLNKLLGIINDTSK